MDWLICFILSILTIGAIVLLIIFIEALKNDSNIAWGILIVILGGLILFVITVGWHIELYG